MKKKSESYYAKMVVYMERYEAKENNLLLKLIYRLLKKYYTHRWERFYD